MVSSVFSLQFVAVNTIIGGFDVDTSENAGLLNTATAIGCTK